VLFFRNQDVSPEEHIAFARQFGKIDVPPLRPKYGDNPEMVVLDQMAPKGEGADEWHSDNTFAAIPPLGSILRAVAVPDAGGDTMFASMTAAYDALSEPMKRALDGLRAMHSGAGFRRQATERRVSRAWIRPTSSRWRRDALCPSTRPPDV